MNLMHLMLLFSGIYDSVFTFLFLLWAKCFLILDFVFLCELFLSCCGLCLFCFNLRVYGVHFVFLFSAFVFLFFPVLLTVQRTREAHHLQNSILKLNSWVAEHKFCYLSVNFPWVVPSHFGSMWTIPWLSKIAQTNRKWPRANWTKTKRIGWFLKNFYHS